MTKKQISLWIKLSILTYLYRVGESWDGLTPKPISKASGSRHHAQPSIKLGG